jgi:phage gpG-like protein
MTYQSGRDWTAVGTNLIYGATHQFGDEERGIPARPYLGLSDDDRRAVVRVLHIHIRRDLGRS